MDSRLTPNPNTTMERILFLAHTESDGTLAKLALEALSAAKNLSSDLQASLAVGITGPVAARAASTVGSCGASGFLVVETSNEATGSADAAAFETICKACDPTIVIAPATSRIARSIPAVAVRIGGRIDTKVTGLSVDGTEIIAERWYYRQRMSAKLTRTHRPWVVVVESGIAPAWSGEVRDVQVAELQSGATQSTKVIGTEGASQGQQTIRPDAGLLFVAGAGWTKKQADGQPHVAEAESLIKGVLERTGASLGSSKSLVDQAGEGQVISLLSHMNQVGQTGSTPRHPKGLATCCHGEEPHVVGWRFVPERRAINLDPNCSWAQGKADVVYVADAFAVIRALNELM